jgi:hypothetical protein
VPIETANHNIQIDKRKTSMKLFWYLSINVSLDQTLLFSAAAVANIHYNSFMFFCNKQRK